MSHNFERCNVTPRHCVSTPTAARTPSPYPEPGNYLLIILIRLES